MQNHQWLENDYSSLPYNANGKISTEFSRLGVPKGFWGIFTRISNHTNQHQVNNQQLHL